MDKPFGIDLKGLQATFARQAEEYDRKYREAKSQMDQRTWLHDLFSRVSHGMNLYDAKRKDAFSDGTTQAMKRKIRAQTIQRVPDGEIVTQYDKNSIEQAEIDYIFDHKVLQSEYDGKDMLKQLWKAFNASYDFGFACVRTGFERDLDGDPRISFKLIRYSDVYPSPDCDFIEEADWYLVREMIPRSTFEALVDMETGVVSDPTYEADVVKYIVENRTVSAMEGRTVLADEKHGVSKTQSVEALTYYERGADEFVTYIPSLKAVLRRTKNFDPRKDVPLHFMVLEPDPEFPLGCSTVMWTMAQQQFADAFGSTAYETLLLALHPPLQVFGNLVNAKIRMRPNAVWPMGTNQNNKIEPYRVETTTLTQYGKIQENVAGKMMQSLNITDSTVASDANVAHYSGTPQGVEQQRADKTVTVNQFQKRVETFFAEWANHAIRSYLASMSGKQRLTVDEKTRRRIFEIEKSQLADQDPGDRMPGSIIDGDKIEVDFDALSADLMSFEVRSGSLIENQRDQERKAIQEMLIPVSQMMGNIGNGNRDAFENIIMQLIERLCELSDIDISQGLADKVGEKLMMEAMRRTMESVMGQGQQIQQMQAQLAGLMPPAQQAPQGEPSAEPSAPMPPEQPEEAPMPMEAEPPEEEEEPPMQTIPL